MEKMKSFDVDLKRLFFEVVKKLWIIILVGALCGAAMLTYAKFFITPQYQATVSIYVQNYTGDNDQKIYSSDLSASQTLVATYSELITSDRVLNKVAEKLDNKYTPGQIRSGFSAVAVEDTAILKISIMHSNPKEAAKIVNAIANVAPKTIMDYAEGSSVKVVDYAKVPTHTSYPSYFKLTLIGCVLGSAVAFAIVVLFFLFNSYIDNEDDITKLFDAPVIGKIPDFDMANSSTAKRYGGYGYGYGYSRKSNGGKK